MNRARALVVALLFAAALAAAVRAGEGERARPLSAGENYHIEALLEGCADVAIDREHVQKNIDELIGLAGGRDAAANLIVEKGLRSVHPLTRLAATEILGRAGASLGAGPRKNALEALNEMLAFDDNYTVRRYAAMSIAGFGDPGALARLYREIPDFDGALRKRILEGPPGGAAPAESAAARKARLGQLGLSISRALDRFPYLASCLEDNVDSAVRERAVTELRRLTGDDNRHEARQWKEWWKEKRDRPESELICQEFNRLSDRTYTMVLIELAALTDAREAVKGLCASLRQGSVPVQMAAAFALGRLGGPAASTALRAALENPDGWVKASAAEALAGCDPQGSAGEFLKLLDDWAPQDGSTEHKTALARVRRAAVAGLKTAGSTTARPRLSALLLEPEANRFLCWEAADALRQMGGLHDLPALVHYAAMGTDRERGQALAAAAEICRRERLPALAGRRELAALSAAELSAALGGAEAGAGTAAAWELDRRGLVSLSAGGLLSALEKAGTPSARMMSMVLLARRGYSPAVADLAAAALKCRGDEVVALAACRAAAEVSSAEAAERYQQSPEGRAGKESLEDLRRKAAASLMELLGAPDVRPRLAAAAAETLAGLVAPDAKLHANALKALMAALAEERLREAGPALCAALRRLTAESFPDEPRDWLRWWQTHQEAREPQGRS